MNITWRLHADVIYSKSEIDVPLAFVDARFVPSDATPEEIAADEAVRVVHITADEAWDWGVCLRCKLPLPLHPLERRTCGQAKRSHCRAARREANVK